MRMNTDIILADIVSWIAFPILILIATQIQGVLGSSTVDIVLPLLIIFSILPITDMIHLVSWIIESFQGIDPNA